MDDRGNEAEHDQAVSQRPDFYQLLFRGMPQCVGAMVSVALVLFFIFPNPILHFLSENYRSPAPGVE